MKIRSLGARSLSLSVFAGTILFICFLASIQSAHGAKASVETTQPTDDVLLSNLATPGAGIQLRYLSGSEPSRWVGVGFAAPSDASLDRITLFISKAGSGASGATVKIALVKLSGRKSTPGVPYTEISSEKAGLPASISTPGTCLTFKLESAWKLKVGENYGVILSFEEAGNSRTMNFLTCQGGDRVGVTFHTVDGGATYATAKPMMFILQSEAHAH